MQSAMRTVKLYGALGNKFGRTHKLSVKSPSEAIKALCVTIPGFEKFLHKSKDAGLTFAVFNGKKNIGEGELEFSGSKDIRIAPVPVGSKRNGLFQTILGVILIAVAWWNPLGWAAGGAMITGVAGAGVSLAVGGVLQMLSPQAKGLGSSEQVENTPSKMIGGAVNTTALGNPIGILAGERVVGGAIISAGVYAEDLA